MSLLRNKAGRLARHARIVQSQYASTSGAQFLDSSGEAMPDPFSRVRGKKTAAHPTKKVATQTPRHNKAQSFSSAPVSLSDPSRIVAQPYEGVDQNFFARMLLKIGGYYSKESIHLRAAKAWYTSVTEQADNKAMLPYFGLEDKFADKYSLLCIHVYLCLVRLRAEGKEGKELAQVIYEDFQEDVEMRVRAAGVKVRISKHLTELEQMFYGSSLSYDKALSGKEELSSALLRNVYANAPEKQKSAETLARYIRREIACLELTDSESVMSGTVSFSKGFLPIETKDVVSETPAVV